MTKIVLIGAGKGGTGKTTATAFIGRALAQKYRVAILDLDTQGPDIPRILGMDNEEPVFDTDWFYPKKLKSDRCGIETTMEVFSPAFLIPRDVAVAWTGDKRKELIHELIEKVKWDNPDILLMDCPPGTSDEIMAVLLYSPRIDGAIIVSTAKHESIDDARRLLALLRSRTYSTPILGVIENMGYKETPEGEEPLFSDSLDVGAELDLEVLGKIPFRRGLDLDEFYNKIADVVAGKIMGV